MRLNCIIFLTFVSVMTLLSGCGGENPNITEIKTMVREMEEAYAARDLKTYLSFYDTSYSFYEELEKEANDLFEKMDKIEVTVLGMIDTTIHMYPGGAYDVIAKYRRKVSYVWREGEQHKEKMIEEDMERRYVKIGEVWKCNPGTTIDTTPIWF